MNLCTREEFSNVMTRTFQRFGLELPWLNKTGIYTARSSVV